MQLLLPFLAAVASVLLGCSLGCTPMDHEPTFLQNVQHSNIVLRGRVRRLVENPQHSTSQTKNYVAVVMVQCILKGDVTPILINVTNVGVTPGRCSRVDLEMDREYLIMGMYYKSDNAVYHNDHQSYLASQANIQEASQACGLDPKYPKDIDPSTAQVQCPQVAGPNDCISDQPAPGLQLPPGPDDEVLIDSEEEETVTLVPSRLPSDDKDNSSEINNHVGDKQDDSDKVEDDEDESQHEDNEGDDDAAETEGKETGETKTGDENPVSAKQGGGSTLRLSTWLLILLVPAAFA